jgi:hypothetical protein
MTIKLIETKTLGTAQAAIELTSIPQTYTDLILLLSLRNSFANFYSDTLLTINNQTSTSTRILYGLSGSVGSYTATNGTNLFTPGATATANTFGNTQLYFTNYTSTGVKSISSDSVIENNSTDNIIAIGTGLIGNSTNPITSITLSLTSGNFVAASTVSLYGILKGSSGGVVVS